MGQELFFKIVDLGLIDYRLALERQKDIFLGVKNSAEISTLIVCRHNPVITLGRKTCRESFLVPAEELQKRGIKVFEVERGGDITYHGPGQLVAYPVFNLNYYKKDIHFFLRQLERVVIELLADFGVKAERKNNLAGVWFGEKKISSIGIAVRNWITFHGISLNVKKDDLLNYRLIKPCGMDIEMISLEDLLGRQIAIEPLKTLLTRKFKDIFSNRIREEAALL